jgi:hypothetical protein
VELKMQNLSIRLELEDDFADKFLAVKERLGYKTNTSVLIHLINEAYQKCVESKVLKIEGV